MMESAEIESYAREVNNTLMKSAEGWKKNVKEIVLKGITKKKQDLQKKIREKVSSDLRKKIVELTGEGFKRSMLDSIKPQMVKDLQIILGKDIADIMQEALRKNF